MKIRWMIKRDIEDALKIEADGSAPRWTENVLIKNLRRRNTIGVVGEYNDQVLCFGIYTLGKGIIEVDKLAVTYSQRRKGYGSELLLHLKNKLNNRRNRLFFRVHESDLDTQLFLKANDLLWVQTIDDSYIMEYSVEKTVSTTSS
jgi:ribosomal protein S18 acetylase RimI-like enzyme